MIDTPAPRFIPKQTEAQRSSFLTVTQVKSGQDGVIPAPVPILFPLHSHWKQQLLDL